MTTTVNRPILNVKPQNNCQTINIQSERSMSTTTSSIPITKNLYADRPDIPVQEQLTCDTSIKVLEHTDNNKCKISKPEGSHLTVESDSYNMAVNACSRQPQISTKSNRGHQFVKNKYINKTSVFSSSSLHFPQLDESHFLQQHRGCKHKEESTSLDKFGITTVGS